MSSNFEMQQDELLGKIYDGKLFKRMIVYMIPYLRYICIAFVLLLINTGIEMTIPYLTMTAVDKHIVPDQKILQLDVEDYRKFQATHQEEIAQERFVIYDVNPVTIFERKEQKYYIVVTSKNRHYIHKEFIAELRERGIEISEDKVVILDPVDNSLLPQIQGKYVGLGHNAVYITQENLKTIPAPIIAKLRHKSISAVKMIGLLLCLIVVVKFFVEFQNIYLTTIASQKAMHDLRSDLFFHLEKMPVSFFDKNPVGRLVTRVTSDIRAIDEMLTSGVITIIQDVFIVVAIMFLMLRLNWQLALVAFAILPAVIFTITIFRSKTRDSYREMRKWLAAVNATISEHISGVKIIQLFNQYKHKTEEFQVSNTKYYNASIRQLKLFAIFRPLIGTSRHIATAIILWYAGGQILENIVTIGLFMAFISYMEKLYEPINNFSEKFNILQGAMAGAERIFALMDKSHVDYKEDLPPAERIKGEIELRGVWLTYDVGDDDTVGTPFMVSDDGNRPDHEYVLKHISFKVKEGEKIALVGHTGSGKTSIVNLILNMYPHQKGEILVNDRNIDDYRLADLRRSIGMVQQDVFLFSGTIRDNIILNNTSITDDEINKIIEYINIAPFINSLPGKLDEPVQERGATFSVGQRQLISFARVLAYDPSIFILDEATSNIDTETEILIQDALFKIMETRTSIIIAHRLSTIQHVDRILVLHKGEIVEEGSHQELLKKEGLYYDLYRLQYS